MARTELEPESEHVWLKYSGRGGAEASCLSQTRLEESPATPLRRRPLPPGSLMGRQSLLQVSPMAVAS
jgi:hypothetical protein